ncbi:rabphilin-3A isoform X2 [Phycodurus eques]|uniref:rabphilin-3A isoform X2 n=1 Tax=Phycodurus eques TaxID=693459 RepID=UPI002ACD51A3|nr:rabphilin-3A isoform X2 [Phycodurus eques]
MCTRDAFRVRRVPWTMSGRGAPPRPRPDPGEELTDEEKRIIHDVLARAAEMDAVEQQRIRLLSSRLEDARRTACGDGRSACLLCGATFGPGGVTAALCVGCRKVCRDCVARGGSTPWRLCAFCKEHREVQKRSGAWFFRGRDPRVLPGPPPANADDPDERRTGIAEAKRHRAQRTAAENQVPTASGGQIRHGTRPAANPAGVEEDEDAEDSDDATTRGCLEFSLLYEQERRQLQCCVIKAKGLKPMDSNGLSDPYVKLHLLPGASKSNKLRTKTLKNTLNPTWNETLVYHGITDEEMSRKTLRYHRLVRRLNCAIRVVTVVKVALYLCTFTFNVVRVVFVLRAVGERRGQVRTQRLHRGDASGAEEAQVQPEEEIQRVLGESYPGGRGRGRRGARSHPGFPALRQPTGSSDRGRGPLRPPGRHGRQRILGPFCQSVRRAHVRRDTTSETPIVAEFTFSSSSLSPFPFTILLIRSPSSRHPHVVPLRCLKPDMGKKGKNKTQTKKKTLNPEFQEEFSYEIKHGELAKKTLDISVWDYDMGRSNDFIGGCQLGIGAQGERLKHWYECLKNKDEKIERWHLLLNDNSGGRFDD